MAGIILFFTFILGLIAICLSLIYFEKFIVAANISNRVIEIFSRLIRGTAVSFNGLESTNLPHIRSPT